MASQLTVSKEARGKAVKTKPIRKVCPFSYSDLSVICIGEECQIWDEKYGCCQIENLSEIMFLIHDLVHIGGGK